MCKLCLVGSIKQECTSCLYTSTHFHEQLPSAQDHTAVSGLIKYVSAMLQPFCPRLAHLLMPSAGRVRGQLCCSILARGHWERGEMPAAALSCVARLTCRSDAFVSGQQLQRVSGQSRGCWWGLPASRPAQPPAGFSGLPRPAASAPCCPGQGAGMHHGHLPGG